MINKVVDKAFNFYLSSKAYMDKMWLIMWISIKIQRKIKEKNVKRVNVN